MAKKKNTALIVGGVVLAGIAVYLLTKKTTIATTTPAPVTPTTPASSTLVTQGTSLISSLVNLFKGSSTPTYTPIGLASTSTPPPAGITAAPAPTQGLNLLNYLNPSADTAYTPDTSGFTSIYDI